MKYKRLLMTIMSLLFLVSCGDARTQGWEPEDRFTMTQYPPPNDIITAPSRDPELASEAQSLIDALTPATDVYKSTPTSDGYDDPGCPDVPEITVPECWSGVDPYREVYVSTRSNTVHESPTCSGMLYYRQCQHIKPTRAATDGATPAGRKNKTSAPGRALVLSAQERKIRKVMS